MPAIPWEWENPITKAERTGRLRTRPQKWTRKLILQVEWKYTRTNMFDKAEPPTPTRIDHSWEDATHNDVSTPFVRAVP